MSSKADRQPCVKENVIRSFSIPAISLSASEPEARAVAVPALNWRKNFMKSTLTGVPQFSGMVVLSSLQAVGREERASGFASRRKREVPGRWSVEEVERRMMHRVRTRWVELALEPPNFF